MGSRAGGFATVVAALVVAACSLANAPAESVNYIVSHDGFTLEDHLRVIREHVRFDLFDYALVNCPLRESPTLVEYAQRGARPVLHDPCAPMIGGAQLVERDLAWTYDGAKIRHAPRQLADAILDLVARGRPSHQTDAAAAQPVS